VVPEGKRKEKLYGDPFWLPEALQSRSDGGAPREIPRSA
jgi:hypothetical protein